MFVLQLVAVAEVLKDEQKRIWYVHHPVPVHVFVLSQHCHALHTSHTVTHYATPHLHTLTACIQSSTNIQHHTVHIRCTYIVTLYTPSHLHDTPSHPHRYDQILVDGLPDWRQPLFYYRRVRKMGLLELSILVLLIATVAHYLYGWAVYVEKQLVLVSEGVT